MEVKEILEQASDIALKAHGLDDAIIGLTQYGLLIYDYDRCIDILMKQNDWNYTEAVEWMDYNVVGAYMGSGSPIFLMNGQEH